MKLSQYLMALYLENTIRRNKDSLVSTGAVVHVFELEWPTMFNKAWYKTDLGERVSVVTRMKLVNSVVWSVR